MIPKIPDEAEFRARLKPHLDRIRTGRHFPDVEMVWMGEAAMEFADLIEEMARFMDEDAIWLIRESQRLVSLERGEEALSGVSLERADGGVRAEMAGVVAAFRSGAGPGLAACIEPDRAPRILEVVTEMERRIYAILPQILEPVGLSLTDAPSCAGLPVNPLTEREAFMARLAPHMKRIDLSAGFMDMDLAWEGEEALEFAHLIEHMAAWIDGEATELVCAAAALRDKATGGSEAMSVAEVRERNGGGFTEVMQPTVRILREGSEAGFKAVWRGVGVYAVRELVRDLVDRAFTRIPGRIVELKEEADRAAGASAMPDP